ncbi:MAG: reverse transcriptase domain-containing protein, partial [Erythrobacter sp.]
MAGLIDSGATHSCISAAALRLLLGTLRPLELDDAHLALKTAGGKLLRVLGAAALPLRFSQKGPLVGGSEVEFIVVEDLGPPLVLGLDFLVAAEARIDFGAMTMSLCPDLDRRSRRRVDVQLRSDFPREAEGTIAAIAAYEQEKRRRASITQQALKASVKEMIREYGETHLDHLNPRCRRALINELLANWQVFALNPDAPTCTTEIEMHIDTGIAQPVASKTRWMNPQKSAILEKQIQIWLHGDKVVPSTSRWNSCPLIVPKPNGAWRVCMDFRRLNAVTVREDWPASLVPDLMQRLSGADWLSSLDLANAYFQIPLDKASQPKTAFSAPSGRYQFTAVPFGLKNAPTVFNKFFSQVLARVKGARPANYFDDVALGSKGAFDQHLRELRAVFQVLIEAGLQLKLQKCEFAVPEIKFCGHLVSKDGMRPDGDGDKVQSIIQRKAPTDFTGLRSFLGACNFFRDYMENFASVAAPLYRLTGKGTGNRWRWDEEHDRAFNQLKDKLASAPVLAHINWDLRANPLRLYTDASEDGLGACLLQRQGTGGYKPVGYASRTLTKEERNYDVSTREALGLFWAVTRHREQLMPSKFELCTDHKPLQHMLDHRASDSRIYRWFLALSEYDFDIRYVKAVDNAVADWLSRELRRARGEALKERERTNADLLTAMGDDREDGWDTVFLFSIHDGDVQIIRVDGGREIAGDSEAEEEAQRPAAAPERRKRGRPRVRDRDAGAARAPQVRSPPAAEAIRANAPQIPAAPVPAPAAIAAQPPAQAAAIAAGPDGGAMPARANARHNAADAIGFYYHALPTHAEFTREMSRDAFCLAVEDYLKPAHRRRPLPADETTTAANDLIARLAARSVVFARRADGLLVRSTGARVEVLVPRNLRQRILELCHSSPAGGGGHFAAERTLARLRGYFWWPMMKEDAKLFCQACAVCAMVRSHNHLGVQVFEQHTIQHAKAPAQIWHIDFIDMPESDGFRAVLVAVCDLSCWVELIPCKGQRQDHVLQALREIVGRHGWMQGIRCDNGSGLVAGSVKQWLLENGVKHWEVPARAPQANGKVEVTNRTAKHAIRARLAECARRGTSWI